ncbi:uncharacterized protein LOC133174957 [Saccostrea echinata]|uniref:uncharacterized protein LOC133174957 n=1 Tax=Saccostrea echinata TaxID=191078 RepID=UPI002A7EC806|nr:uncharacterized protein LOC133174957 [Saccostrea echinata]
MVVNHDRLKKCVDRDLPLWLSRYQEKFRAQSQEGGELSSVPLSPGEKTPSSEVPGPSQLSSSSDSPPRIPRKRGRPRKVRSPSTESAKSSDGDLTDSELYCFCRRPDDGGLMIQCDQCDGWFHGVCVGVTSEEASSLDQYICPDCMGEPRVANIGVVLEPPSWPRVRRVTLAVLQEW